MVCQRPGPKKADLEASSSILDMLCEQKGHGLPHNSQSIVRFSLTNRFKEKGRFQNLSIKLLQILLDL